MMKYGMGLFCDFSGVGFMTNGKCCSSMPTVAWSYLKHFSLFRCWTRGSLFWNFSQSFQHNINVMFPFLSWTKANTSTHRDVSSWCAFLQND